MNSKLAMLIGMLLSDGSIFFDRSKRTFCIQFTNKVEGLREVFKSLMTECFGVAKFREHTETNALSVRVFSSKIAKFLFTFSPTFRKLPCKSMPKHDHEKFICNPVTDKFGREWPDCRIPNEILEEREFSINFIRAFASGDGSVFFSSNHRVCQIELTCFHPILRKQLVECFRLIGINCRTKDRGVFISAKSDLLKFRNIVGFLPESLVCDSKSKWLGLPKNKVLEIALNFLS